MLVERTDFGKELSILFPFRDADGTRTPSKEWIVKRWAHFWPEAEIIIASDDGVDPFNKSLAVNNAVAQATRRVFAVVDADSWVDVSWVLHGMQTLSTRKGWTRPTRAFRLKQGVSDRILALDPTGPFPAPGNLLRESETRTGVLGFVWLITAEAWWDKAWYNEQGERRGMDERIRGWGGEDSIFTWVATSLIGPPLRVPGEVYSLWHTRPRDTDRLRVWHGQGRRRDNPLDQEKERLALQYRRAISNRSLMRTLLNQP